jgi:uncharacterized membrane protein
MDILIQRYYTALSILVVFIAILLRVYNLGNEALWLDEAVYANNSYTDFQGFVDNTRFLNSSPILLPYIYYIFGDLLRDPFLVRIFPALFGVFAVVSILLLPRVGASYVVSLLSAFWLAMAPSHIEYSQEVREYSLSALMSCMLILAFLGQLKYSNRRTLGFFSMIVFLTPLCSYGTCFLMLSVLFVYFVQRIGNRRINTLEVLALMIPMLLSMGISYDLTAKYQMHTGQAWYLAGFYPLKGWILGWLAHSIIEYVSWIVGGEALGLFSLFVLGAYFAGALFRKTKNLFGENLFFVFITLICGSIMASFLSLYPFGGIRQQLFASPLIIICVVTSLQWLGEMLKLSVYWVIVAVIVLISCYLIPIIPSVYGPKEDILSAVNQGLSTVDDKDVYVYYGALPAVLFHYPDRSFYRSHARRGELDYMAEEMLEKMQGCYFYLLFSHGYKSEKADLLELLLDYGIKPVSEQSFANAEVIRLRRCR